MLVLPGGPEVLQVVLCSVARAHKGLQVALCSIASRARGTTGYIVFCCQQGQRDNRLHCVLLPGGRKDERCLVFCLFMLG